jgi:hypothetical protein
VDDTFHRISAASDSEELALLRANDYDISWTYERFGNSVIREDFSASHFAAPRPLVSPRFLDVLRNEGVRNCAFLPVRAAD